MGDPTIQPGRVAAPRRSGDPAAGGIDRPHLPDFPGYRPYCPDTAGAKDGAWYGPDMEKARRLVKESGTTDEPVTVWTIRSLADRAVGSYLVQLLNNLRYRASLRRVSCDSSVAASTDSRNKLTELTSAMIWPWPRQQVADVRVRCCDW
jgi:peptide/nickel transport system substrate-binding protein